MSDIFVRYAKEDREKARTFAIAFQDRNWSVFWDRVIPTGKTWREVIEAELKDAKCIVVLWSRESVESRWVIEEAEIAIQRKILIPVLIESVSPPLGFQSLQAADLTDWIGSTSVPEFKNLVKDIGGIVGTTVRGAGNHEYMDGATTAEREGAGLNSVQAQPNNEHGLEGLSHPAPNAHADTQLPTRLTPLKGVSLLLWCSILAYWVFTVLLLGSGGSDQKAGYMFAANALILSVGSLVSYLKKVRISIICGLGSLAQIAILIGMLLIPVGDALITVPLNLGIGAVFAALLVYYRKREQRQSPLNNPLQRKS